MSERANLVRVLTTATGNSTPITLGAAYSQLFMTPAEAGAIDGRPYTYLIVDGNNWELGKGVYSAAGSTLARTIILGSRSSGTLGTSRISLSGTAQVRFVEAAEDMGGVRGTRVVTGTSDALANSDLNRPVTYNNASAIAVTLAQAGASNLFLDGWATYIRNIGAGTVTITPTTSTINGASTLVIAQSLGAFIWSDGTNYHAFILPNSKPLLASNNLSDLASAATARGNIAAAPFEALAERNIVVNSFHQESQRWENTAVSFPSGSMSKYVTDNVAVQKSGTSVLTAQRVASGISGVPWCEEITVNTAQASIGGDVAIIHSYIEGVDFAAARWGTADAVPIAGGLFFRAPVTGVFSIYVYSADSSGVQSTSFTATVAGSYQFYPLLFPATTTGNWYSDHRLGADVQIYFAHASVAPNCLATAGNVIGYTGLCLWPGLTLAEVPVAARWPLLRRSFELPRCERLFRKTYGRGVLPGSVDGSGTITFIGSAAGAYMSYRFPRMRIPPAGTLYNPTTGATGSMRDSSLNSDLSAIIGLISDSGITIQNTAASSASAYSGHVTLDASF